MIATRRRRLRPAAVEAAPVTQQYSLITVLSVLVIACVQAIVFFHGQSSPRTLNMIIMLIVVYVVCALVVRAMASAWERPCSGICTAAVMAAHMLGVQLALAGVPGGIVSSLILDFAYLRILLDVGAGRAALGTVVLVTGSVMAAGSIGIVF